jgi:surface polysaccharide O-acyltransferase-like enzyme
MDPKAGDISLPVDLIRTVAIILVILLHASAEPNLNIAQMSSQGVQLWWASDIYGSFARTCIPLFVMLTGVLLLQPSKADEPIRVFFSKRWLRIGVPFIFWGGVYFAWDFLVDHQINYQPISIGSIVNGLLTGPDYQFWFLYLLLGLYLLTPIIRIIVKNAKWEVLKYFLLVWFIGTAIAPLLGLFTQYTLDANLFVVTGWVGYFVLGAYIVQLQVRRSILLFAFILGSIWTIVGTYLLVATIGEHASTFFLDAFSFNIIISSAALFLLLSSVSSKTVKTKLPHGCRVVKLIGQNTLPIFLLHVIVLEALQRGYFRLKISLTTINPIIEIPLITAVTLLICLAVIVPLKKIPNMKRVIG